MDDDTHVVPLDALTVINYLNSFGSGFVPDNAGTGPPFYDTNGDFSISPIDALLVINAINASKGGEGEAAARPGAVDAVLGDSGTLDLLFLSVAPSQQSRQR